jgi:putative YphP/YqiW family bacilliredoxin
MRTELTNLGVEELRDVASVDAAMSRAESEATLVIINSVCGCAAGNARPAVTLAKQVPDQPKHYVTVFAGQDLEATERMRDHLAGIPPSSPFIALIKDGQPVYVLERRHIEGRSSSAIALDLAGAFGRYCGESPLPAAGQIEQPETGEKEQEKDGLPPTFRSIL